jgi:hypothetical protein
LALGRAAADTVSYTSYSSIRLSPEAYRSGKMPIGLQPQPSQNKKSSRIAESNKKQVSFRIVSEHYLVYSDCSNANRNCRALFDMLDAIDCR